MYDFNSSPLIRQQMPYHGKYTVLQRVLFLILLFLAAEFIAAVPTYVVLFATVGSDLTQLYTRFLAGDMTQTELTDSVTALTEGAMETPQVLLVQLIRVAVVAGALMIFAFCIEHRNAAALALRAKPARMGISYLVGAVVGVALFAASVGVCYLTRAVSVSYAGASAGWIVLFLLAYLLQGFSEEWIIHGYVMTVFLSSGRRIWVGLVFSSLLFSLLHLGNDGVGVVALLNLFLFGLLMGLITLRTGNLWAASAIHSLWNFAQGNLFGVSVSGASLTPSVLATAMQEGRELTNGGAFGLEGGFAVTLVLLFALLAFLFFPTRAGIQQAPPDPPFGA
jgi:hypothetical protein